MNIKHKDLREALGSLQFDVFTDKVALLSGYQIRANRSFMQSLYGQSLQIDAYVVAVCTRGKVQMQVEERRLDCLAGQIAVIVQFSHLRILDVSDDFDGFVFAYDYAFMSTNIEAKIHPWFTLMQHPVLDISPELVTLMADYYRMLRDVLLIEKIPQDQVSRIIVSLIEVNYVFFSALLEINTNKRSTAEFHTECFLKLLVKHVCQYHTLDFYANELNISTKHLMASVKEATGRTAFSVLNQVLLVIAKHQLAYTALSMKELAPTLGFATQSSFSAWFRKCTGLSPSAYRAEQR